MTPHQQMILGIIAAVFASSGFWALVQQQLHMKAEKQDDMTEIKERLTAIQRHSAENDEMTRLTKTMVMGLANDKIKFLCQSYITRWEKEGIPLTPEEHRELNKYLYKPYKAMGGDGTVEKLVEQFETIPIGGVDDEY